MPLEIGGRGGISIAPEVISPLQHTIDALRDSQEWAQMDTIQQLDYLTDYESQLESVINREYEGGWDAYQKTNPLSVKYLEDVKKNTFNNAQVDIEDKRKQWVSDWWKAKEGGPEGSFLRGVMTLISEGTWNALGWGAKALGFDETAKKAFENVDVMQAGYDAIANTFAETALKFDDPLKVTNELYNFAANFLPVLKPTDKSLIREIAEKEGVLEATGLMAAFNPYNIAGMLGHFARIRTIMGALPLWPAKAGSLAAMNLYSLKYALAVGISEGLEIPLHQNSVKHIMGAMAGTYGAMFAGQGLHALAMRLPIMVSLFSKMPSEVALFLGGRIADIGESLANAVELGISTGDPWMVIKGFPAALIANMIEEIIIDIPGTIFGITPGAHFALKQRQLNDLTKLEIGIESRMEHESGKDKRSLQKALKRIRGAKEKRRNQLLELVKRDVRKPNTRLNINKEAIQVEVNRLIKEEGMDRYEALENAVSAYYVDGTEFEAYKEHATEQFDKDVAKTLGPIARAGHEVAKLFGKEAKAFKEAKVEAEKAAVTEMAEVEGLEPLPTEEREFEEYIEKAYEKRVVEEKRVELKKKISLEQIESAHAELEAELTEEERGELPFSNYIFENRTKPLSEVFGKVYQFMGPEFKNRYGDKSISQLSDSEIKNIKETYILSMLQSSKKVGDFAAKLNMMLEIEKKIRKVVKVKKPKLKKPKKKPKEVKIKKKSLSRTVALQGGISLSGMKAAGWDIETIRETGNLFLMITRKSGRSPDELAEDLIEQGLLPPSDNPTQALYDALIAEHRFGFKPVVEEITEAEFDEAQAEYWVEQTEADLFRQLERGEITEKQFDKAVKELERKEYFAIAEKETGIKYEALRSLHAWRARIIDKRLKRAAKITPRGQFIVDPAAYRKEYRREYKGERIAGETTIFIDGMALIELAYDAPLSAAHHEAMHFAMNFALNDTDLKALFDEYGTEYDISEAYGKWTANEETQSFIGKIFTTIKNFLNKLVNVLKGNGFTSVTDVFTRVYEGDIVYRDDTDLAMFTLNQDTNGFINEKGFVPAMSFKENQKAYNNNWIRKEVMPTSDQSYSVKELDGTAIQQIQNDLKKYNTDYYRDVALTVEDKNQYYFATMSQFKNNDESLSATLETADIKQKAKVSTYYAIDDAIDVEETAKNYADIKGIVKLPRDIFNWFKEYVKRTKQLRKAEYKKKDPINWFESYFALPAYLKEKSLHLRHMIEYEYEAERKRKVMISYFNKIVKPYFALNESVMREANEMLLKSDSLSKDLTDEQMKPYSSQAVLGYKAVRVAMDTVIGFEVKSLKKQKAELQRKIDQGEVSTTEAVAKLNDKITQIDLQIKRMQNRVEKGYLPHIWDQNAKWVISFAADPAKIDSKKFLQVLKGLKGDTKYWTERTAEAFNQVDVTTYRFHYRSTDAYLADRAALEKFLGKDVVTAKPYEMDKLSFDLNVTRLKLRNMFDKIVKKTLEESKKSGKEEAVIQGLEAALERYNIEEKVTGWRAHELKRKGTYGYELNDIQGVIRNYITGYSGLFTKREKAIKLFDEYANVPIENKNERRVTENFVNTALHVNNNWDNIQGKITGFLFTKYLAFNIPFHIRNRFQPWYLGWPVLSRHFGIKQAGTIAKELAMAQADIRGLELWFLQNDLTIENETELVNSIKGLRKGEFEKVLSAVEQGLLAEQLPEEWKDAYQNEINKTKMTKALGGTLKLMRNWITLSDAKNRLQVFLAGIRMGANVETALELTRRANVVYKKWNTLGFFQTGFGRKIRFLFPFQKYQWHVAEMQIRMAVKGMFGPILMYWLISQLLGGKEANPLFRWIKRIIGVKASVRARERLIGAMGGQKKLLELLDRGLLSFGGVDMSNQFKVDPFRVFDPLTGGNIGLDFVQSFQKAGESLLRGRIAKAALEDNFFTPRVFNRIYKAYRQATEGVTTRSGSAVVTVSGAPLRLNFHEMTLMSFGFMPLRVGKHLKARRDVRGLSEYFATDKSRIGTRYKIAYLEKDQHEMDYVKKLVRDFNKEVREYKIGGEFVTPPISKTTLNNWLRGADTKRSRAIIKELYP